MEDVLIVYLGSRGGGVLDTWEIYEGLKRHNYERYSVLIAAHNPFLQKFKEFSPNSLHVVKTHGRSFWSAAIHTILLVRPFKILKMITDINPKVLFFTMEHSWMLFVVFWLKLLNSKIDIVYTKHNPIQFDSMGSGFLNKILHRIDIFLFNKANYIFTLSDYVRKSLLKIPNVNSDRIRSFPLGIHYSIKNENNHGPFFKDNKLHLLFFGRILSYKGIDVLAEAFEIMKNENLPVILTIAGEGNINKNTLDKLNNAGAILLNKWINDDDLSEMLLVTDVVVVPYTHASQSGPVGIAIAHHIPIIATDVGGLPEQIKHDLNGLVIKSGDAKAIVNAVKSILQNISLLNKYSQGAKELCEKDFSWNFITKKMDSFFNDILKHK